MGNYGLPHRMGVIHSDVKPEYFATHEHYLTEKNAREDAVIIGRYLKKLGIEPILLPADNTLPQRLKMQQPEIVLNLADSLKGYENLASAVPGILELLDIPYTGADILGMSLDTNKFLIKKLFEQNGLPIPRYQLFNTATDPIDPTLRYPLISKLNEIHGGVEINLQAISENEKDLRDRLKHLIATYHQPVLVEEFIVGREITIILLEGLNKKVYMAEKIFKKKSGKYYFSTFEDQWLKTSQASFSYRRLDDEILKGYARKAFDTAKMMDYGKFDVRLDSSGRYFFIDSNTNPAFGPKELDCALSNILDLYGIDFIEILKRLIQNTLRDYQGRSKLPLGE